MTAECRLKTWHRYDTSAIGIVSSVSKRCGKDSIFVQNTPRRLGEWIGLSWFLPEIQTIHGILEVLPSPPGIDIFKSNKRVESGQVGKHVVRHRLLIFLEVFRNLFFDVSLSSQCDAVPTSNLGTIKGSIGNSDKCFRLHIGEVSECRYSQAKRSEEHTSEL